MAANIEIYNPATLAAPLGLYKHVTRVRASEYLFIAGQLAVDADGNSVGTDDFDAQARQVFGNLEKALASAGAGYANVVKFTTYLTSAERIGDFMRMREALFSGYFPDGAYPPNTLLVVDRLVRPEFLLEVEAVAAL